MGARQSKRVLIAAALLFAVGVAAGGFWLGGMPSPEARRVEIPPKSGTGAIGRILAKNGVVRSAAVFRAYTVLSGQARRLKAGEYEFPAGTGLRAVVRRLAAGETLRHSLTVPEGFSARQIAEKLSAEGLADGAAFLEAVNDPELAHDLGLPGATLEGYLFPDTYEVPKYTPATALARRMVERFRAKVGEELFAAGRAQGLSELQLVTLASIIEREVKVDAERAKVASVFYNRLRKSMRLESCATVLYGLHRVGGALSLADLADPSPYNTYRHRGLPPAPISNPGLPSLNAAAHPAQTDFLFFVVRPDGQHVFSRDFESHKRAKWNEKRARDRQRSGSAATERP